MFIFCLDILLIWADLSKGWRTLRAETNGQQVAGHDDRPHIF